ncbi:hypothetical protein EVJ58_g6359 [Rhodofomes roseus]|uniref:Uncharacterized protein n=1 Tax=Rhodofomes roseus TaxID=34475 RepID=A0A4Y9Y933_9APHY|nr:hypothetical protein EVJ58_g6359 [Rhodofomes roseus]
MRYLTIVSTAFIAATAVPASALPWGLGIRNVQRDVTDELYTRELTARSSKGNGPRPPNPHQPRPPITPRPHYPPVPHPGPRPSKPDPRRPNPGPDRPVRPKPAPRPRELDEYLLARAAQDDDLLARAFDDELYARMDVDELD